jgi:hypothetical protein
LEYVLATVLQDLDFFARCDDFLVGQAVSPVTRLVAAIAALHYTILISSRAATISWWDRRFRLSPAWLRLLLHCITQS